MKTGIGERVTGADEERGMLKMSLVHDFDMRLSTGEELIPKNIPYIRKMSSQCGLQTVILRLRSRL